MRIRNTAPAPMTEKVARELAEEISAATGYKADHHTHLFDTRMAYHITIERSNRSGPSTIEFDSQLAARRWLRHHLEQTHKEKPS